MKKFHSEIFSSKFVSNFNFFIFLNKKQLEMVFEARKILSLNQSQFLIFNFFLKKLEIRFKTKL